MQISELQCPVKTPEPPALPWILELQGQIFCCSCFSGLLFFCPFLSGLFSAEGSLVKPISAALLYFLFFLLVPVEMEELPILKHLCCVGQVQICEKNYCCRKKIKGKFSFEMVFLGEEEKKWKCRFQRHPNPPCRWFLLGFVQMKRFCSDVPRVGVCIKFLFSFLSVLLQLPGRAPCCFFAGSHSSG